MGERAMNRAADLIGLIILFAAAAGAQPAQIVNAQLQTRSASGGLESEFRSLVSRLSQPAWIGYTVPAVPGEHRMCCNGSDSCCGPCRLEGRLSGSTVSRAGERVQLEGPANLLVLYRTESGRVQKIRTFSEQCELDAGGLPFYWFNDVRPRESLALLGSFAAPADPQGGERRLSDSAVAAVALHQGNDADRLLEQFVEPGRPESLRSQTAFWLGVARGRRGFEVLRRMLQEDPGDKVRDKVIFAISQSSEPEAMNLLIETARKDPSSRVRGQALFWLAHKAGEKAAATITDALENDPETEVKKKAVFALSQLPSDEGIPRLIHVARTHRNVEVRKQAIFWLGQSRDQRALAFFEEVLFRK
jgi:hypothetical protein